MGLMDDFFKKKAREYLVEQLGRDEFAYHERAIDDALSRTKDITVKPVGADEFEVKLVFRTKK